MDINRYSPSYTVEKTHMTKLLCYTTQEIFEMLYAIKVMKAKFNAKEHTKILNGLTVALLFGDTSLRTRSAIEIGVPQLGGTYVDLPYNKADMTAGENFKDITNVIARYGVGAIITRGIPQSELDNFMEVSPLPIINSTNDDYVPMQALCDLFTIWEKKRALEGLKLAYVGKGTSTANSLLMGAVKCGIKVSVATPKQFPLNPVHLERAREYGEIVCYEKAEDAVKDADIVYTDSYCYHATPNEEERSILKPFSVTTELMALAKEDALFMHPLPATRGLEVQSEVIDGKQSIVYDQAENKIHTIKAVLAMLINY